ncbi:kinase-like domain-containing protein [Gigaspora rosea]|uniref:Kinase-like domain-containing protein n=1 Tax=Gigaspora rosea TaxID=44941 RepID=A0A397UJ53_9GLOM|nr:kinase-like domain-containing protein [Gigaspora rosea]
MTVSKFNKEFGKWTSGNSDIDNFIQQIQLKAQYDVEVIEWIPFYKFTNIKYLAKGGFGTVFKAIWTDGYIRKRDFLNSKWVRRPQRSVCLKSLNDSKEDIKKEFLNEVENQHKQRGESAIRIYGITRNRDDGNYMMVMQYAKLGRLASIHNANLAHKDFHSGNIVNETFYGSYITDFGLCRPVSQDSSSKGIFGVLPYIAPEVLYGEKYTIESDIYSFGIIMSEVFTGYPPYHDIPHDFSLATQICLGHRPEMRCEIPQYLLDLMNKCLDAEPQNRPTAKVLKNMLEQFCIDLLDKKTELCKQIEEIKTQTKIFQYMIKQIKQN